MRVALFLSNFLNPIFCVCQKGPLFRCSSVGKKKNSLFSSHVYFLYKCFSKCKVIDDSICDVRSLRRA